MKLAEGMTTKHLNHYNWPKLVLLGHDWLMERSTNVASKFWSQSLIKTFTILYNNSVCLSMFDRNVNIVTDVKCYQSTQLPGGTYNPCEVPHEQ